MGEWVAYALDQRLHERLAEHVVLTFLSLAFAVIIGVALGMLAFRRPRLRGIILAVTGAIQTVPSPALLALLLVITGSIGALPALIALTLYGLLPIVRATLTGLESASPQLMEAAEALGFTPAEQVRHVRLPLALPQLISGIRVAAALGVGIATVAAFIGAGGLGQLITRGLFLSDTKLILLGAIPAMLLALALDGMIALLQRSFFAHRPALPMQKLAAAALPALLLAMALITLPRQDQVTVRIGSKNFTEQLVVGEIVAQALEREGIAVERRFSLGGSTVAHQALLAGKIDLYVEYTGTALTAIFGQPVASGNEAVFRRVCAYYRKRQLRCLPPLGFNNTYVMAMRAEDARRLDVHALSDLKRAAGQLRAGFDFEFAGRPDGYRRMKKQLGLRFREVRDMEPGLMYGALANGSVDIISAYATDGRIRAGGFVTLADDAEVFPPYEAFIVVSERLAEAHPELITTLKALSGAIDDAAMMEMNYRADALKEPPAEVARKWLAR